MSLPRTHRPAPPDNQLARGTHDRANRIHYHDRATEGGEPISEADLGRVRTRQAGSRARWVTPCGKSRTTVASHEGHDIPAATLPAAPLAEADGRGQLNPKSRLEIRRSRG
jgi:hypothetical protein